MKKNKTKKILVTHDGSFHVDDIFAAATLSIYLKKNNQPFEIIRTRDEEIIKRADYVFDVGGMFNESANRFDHHQTLGAGARDKIPYAAFGLIWKKFGVQVSGKKEVADLLERKLILPLDANDNGIDLYKNNFSNVSPYTLQDVFATFSPTALEDLEKDAQFTKALAWAEEILKREIKKGNDQIEVAKIIRNFYKKTEDKRLIVIDKPKVSRFEIWEALLEFPEPLFVIYGDAEGWSTVAMRKERNNFGSRKDFPKSWAGLKQKELQKITGVKDAVFCHNGLFLSVAKSKVGAIELGKLALKA